MLFLCMKGAKDLQVFDVPMTTIPEQMSSNLHSLKAEISPLESSAVVFN